MRAARESDNYAKQRAIFLERNTTHGLSKNKHYPKWRDMQQRCYNQSNKFYADYGGRGVVVCDEWKNDPAAFISWCESKEPIPQGYSLDRYPDLNGIYSPTNCRFASPSQQNRNMRSNIWIEYHGECLIYKDFVTKYGVVSYDTAKGRVRKRGWDRIKAALTPLQTSR